MELEKIQGEVEKQLSNKRYYHSVCVMERCGELAKIYNVDINSARKVGIVHDIAKEMENQEKFEYIKKNNIIIDKIEEKYPGLLHAKIGADIAIKRFRFTEEMGQAILSHTTGKEGMDILAKILYIADWTGKDRKYKDTKYIRRLSEKNINEAMLYTLSKIIIEKVQNKEELHVDTVLTFNEILRAEDRV